MFNSVRNQLRTKYPQYREFIKFSIVGGSGVIVNMGILILLTRLFNIPLEIASPIAIELSIISNFILNNIWTFGDRTVEISLLTKFIRFHLVAISAGVVNYLILLALVYGFDILDIIANLIGIAAATIVNYLLNSLWTWRIQTDHPSDKPQV